MGPVGIERNVLFGLLFGCDPSSGASFATISRVIPLTLAFPLLVADGAGGADEDEDAAGGAAGGADWDGAAWDGVAGAGVSVPASIAFDCA